MDAHEPLRITSPQNPRLKAAAALRKRRERDRAGLTLIEGVRECERAAGAGVDVVEVFLGPGAAEDAAARALASRLAGAGADLCEVSPRAWDKLAVREGTVPIVVVARIPATGLSRLEEAAGPAAGGAAPWEEPAAGGSEQVDRAPENTGTPQTAGPPGAAGAVAGGAPLYLVADRVQKPGNVGAILRTADGAGLDGLVVTDGATDLFNPNTVRASIGTVFTVPVAACGAAEAIDWFRARGVRTVVSALAGAAVPYTSVDCTAPTAIVVGSEDAGVAGEWLHAADEIVRIPMRGAADSLNVSISAAILLYEALRQREKNTS